MHNRSQILLDRSRVRSPAVPIDHVTHYAETKPDDVAVIDDRPGQEPRILDWVAFNELCNSLANGLLDLGVAPGEPVAWWRRAWV